MKIYDCVTFFSEHLMLDVRFHILNEYVEKFIITESLYSHSGKPKKLNFNINNYSKFKDKIIYLVIDIEPENLIEPDSKNLSDHYKRLNSLKRIELSYNYMMKEIRKVHDEDLVILSDNDEIPNLNSNQFKNSKKNIFIFKQLLFYYKFNLLYDVMPWFGSKACKKKYLNSLSWLRNLKNKNYPFWRIDALFSKSKSNKVEIIDNGGWHFTNLMTPKDLFIKMNNFGHHDEFERSGLSENDLKNKMDNDVVFYNHFLDQSSLEKWNYNYKLKKIENELLPNYLVNNKEKYKKWFR